MPTVTCEGPQAGEPTKPTRYRRGSSGLGSFVTQQWTVPDTTQHFLTKPSAHHAARGPTRGPAPVTRPGARHAARRPPHPSKALPAAVRGLLASRHPFPSSHTLPSSFSTFQVLLSQGLGTGSSLCLGCLSPGCVRSPLPLPLWVVYSPFPSQAPCSPCALDPVASASTALPSLPCAATAGDSLKRRICAKNPTQPLLRFLLKSSRCADSA